MGFLTKIKQWFKVKSPSRSKEARRTERRATMSEEHPKKSPALEFFLNKYAPEANEESFKLVARAYLRNNGYPEADPDNLSAEQESLLIQTFKQISKSSMEDWICGLVMGEWQRKEAEKLGQIAGCKKQEESG